MDRTHEPLFLPRSPLVFTLGVVQFDPVLAVANYIPDIQESLRKSGYPKLRERMITHKFVKTEGDEMRAEMKKQWEFHDTVNRTSILVDQDGVAVQTTAYSTYEKFEKLLTLALECVADRLQVSEILRCGLRYIDIVETPERGDIAEWVDPALLGLPKLEGFKKRHSDSTTELEGKGGSTIRVRASQTPKGVVLPPDLLPCDLAFGKKPVRDTPFVLLDLDHFSLKHFAYEQAATLKHLSTLHDGLDLAFRTTVTPNAIEQWKKA